MKGCLIQFLLLGMVVSLQAQHTSEDFKDAAACGPFPIYVGLAYTTSKNLNFADVAERFMDYYEDDAHPKKWVRGIYGVLGSPIIPKRWKLPVSVAVEVKYYWSRRNQDAGDIFFRYNSQQIAAGLGIRYAPFPFVIQGSVAATFFSQTDFIFDDNASRKTLGFNSNSIIGSLRVTLLDPAGSDGGVGYFVEFGGSCIVGGMNETEAQSRIIRLFDAAYDAQHDYHSNSVYLGFGIVVPLAIRIR